MDDLISRQVAIDALDCINGVEEVLRSLPSAQPEILACGEGELNVPDTNVEDMISRQAVIDAIMGQPPEPHYPSWYAAQIEKLPAAQPEQVCVANVTLTDEQVKEVVEKAKNAVISVIEPEPHWTPCSKRMPEEHEWIGTKTFGTTISDEVYVTFESPKGERFTKHLSFQNGKVSSFTQREIDVFYKGAVPIAWMPLPEPYRGGEK